MIKFIRDWKRGLVAILLFFMAGALAPLVVLGIILAIIIFPMFLLGFGLDFWWEYIHEITAFMIVFLGPRLIGEQWDKIVEIINLLESKE